MTFAVLIAGGSLAALIGLVRGFSMEAALQQDEEAAARYALDALEVADASGTIDARIEGAPEAEPGASAVDLTPALEADPAYQRAVLAPRAHDPVLAALAPRLTVHVMRDRARAGGAPTPGLHRLVCRIAWNVRGADGRTRERALAVGRLVLR